MVPVINNRNECPETDGLSRISESHFYKYASPPSALANIVHVESSPNNTLPNKLERLHSLHREGRLLQAKGNLVEAQPMLEEVMLVPFVIL